MRFALASTTSLLALAVYAAPTQAAVIAIHETQPFVYVGAPLGVGAFTLVGNTSGGQTTAAVNASKSQGVNLTFDAASGSFSGAAETVDNVAVGGSAVSGAYTYTAGPLNLSHLSTYIHMFTGRVSETLQATATGLSSGTAAANFTLYGTPVAPVEKITVVPRNVFTLVGQTANIAVTVSNVGNGDLAGADLPSLLTNLHGSVSAISPGGVFSGAGGSFNLMDNHSTAVPSPNSQAFTYVFAPTVRGRSSATVTTNTINGNSDGTDTPQTTVSTLMGTAVAPVELTKTQTPVLTRIGTVGSNSFTISNRGDGNKSGQGAISNLNGTVSAVSSSVINLASSAFSLGDGTSQSVAYSFAPVARGLSTATGTVNYSDGSADGTNSAQTVNVTLQGKGVGPTYRSFKGGTTANNTPATGGSSLINFGNVTARSVGKATIDIKNATTDAGGENLTGLTIKSIVISGADASLFSVDALSGLTDGSILDEGNMASLVLDFAGVWRGFDTADLLITTDQGVGFGADGGATFDYVLLASSVPEPAGFAVLGIGLLGLVAVRRKAGAAT